MELYKLFYILFQLNNNGGIPNIRSGRISNAGISIKDVFNVNGGPGEVC